MVLIITICAFLSSLVYLNAEQQGKPCVKWGNTFDVSIDSKNVRRDCKFEDGRSICCAALNGSVETRGVGQSFVPRVSASGERSGAGTRCSITKKYISSPLELRDIALAHHIDKTFKADNMEGKLDYLMAYVVSPDVILNSTKWLNRVQIHMSSEHVPAHSSDDEEFLSRFEMTRTCGDGSSETWYEWIEPITVHARHPFGFGRCRNTPKYFTKGIPRTGRSDVDYVLIQSGYALYNQTHSPTGRPIISPNSGGRSNRRKHYMLDAGTSTFDSSLLWFTCGYSQRKISFDSVFAWEMTLLEPNDYWRRVPSLWKPFWHFFNVPIVADMKLADSPLRFLKQIASPNDFVSFKLDIDYPEMEMPIALSLLSDPSIGGLIDEFFFELHFRCEVMTSCGWGKRVPAESHGLVLDRSHVLDFFLALRKAGIRAHIWP